MLSIYTNRENQATIHQYYRSTMESRAEAPWTSEVDPRGPLARIQGAHSSARTRVLPEPLWRPVPDVFPLSIMLLRNYGEMIWQIPTRVNTVP